MKVKRFFINSKNLLIIVALLVMVITYSSFLNHSLTCNSPMPVIENGFMDATNWCLVNDKNTLLRGEWEFYGNQV